MENASKALIMAAGVLLAVMILAIVVYFFSTLSVFPNSDDEVTQIEQITAFNLEYEVYDKKIMYGVDVISALNKAKSNNEKYVEGNFLSGDKSGTEFYVDIGVTLKEDIKESLLVYHIYTNSVGKVMETSYDEGNGINNQVFLNSSSGSTASDKFVIPKNALTTFTTSTQLKTVKDKKVLNKGTYSLRSANTMLEDLLSFSDNMKQVIKNSDSGSGDKWSSAIWETALYNFKTKKFKCIDVHYSDTTGRIDRLDFEEI